MDNIIAVDFTKGAVYEKTGDEVESTSDYIIPLVILLILTIFLGYMLYLMLQSGFQATSQAERVTSDIRPDSIGTCPIDQCATNLFTGVKRCPVPGGQIDLDLATEVCNSRTLCDNPVTPYAIQNDGSTDISGACDPGVECRCSRINRCPEYVAAAFTTNGGNPYQSLDGQRLTFPQTSTRGLSGTIEYPNPSTTFCAAPATWLPLSNPGCNFATSGTMNSEAIRICMGLPRGCNGLTGNPCRQGTLAVVTDNPENVNINNLADQQFSCVDGTPCQCNQIAIYDTNFGGVVCRDI